jgi:hypothetical protein
VFLVIAKLRQNEPLTTYTTIFFYEIIRRDITFIAVFSILIIDNSKSAVSLTIQMQFATFPRSWKNNDLFSVYNGPTNALICNKTLIQMSHTKTFKITPTYFDHQMIIIRELFYPG